MTGYISGGHIRGRLFKQSPTTWAYVVTNTLTGAVIAGDNTGSHEALIDDANRTVAAARIAWMAGFGNKAVSVSKPRYVANDGLPMITDPRRRGVAR